MYAVWMTEAVVISVNTEVLTMIIKLTKSRWGS